MTQKNEFENALYWKSFLELQKKLADVDLEIIRITSILEDIINCSSNIILEKEQKEEIGSLSHIHHLMLEHQEKRKYLTK